MNGAHEDIENSQSDPDFAPHDFSSEPREDAHERRLHMRAFDYWHALKGENRLPLFQDLNPGGLAPFKTNTLLLEFVGPDAVVRFIGAHVSILIDAPVAPGTSLAKFPESAFARALLGQFADEAGRADAVEFEFVEDLLDWRGIMLPFSRDGEHPHFVMVVTNFRRRDDGWHREPVPLEDALAASTQAARNVVHPDGMSRESLYAALAEALAFHEEAKANPDAYAALLKKHGLKVQARAPFTPALKLCFGKNYDKTRLTEYAAALAFAVRQGQTSAGLAAFLKAQPGGIKGCVQAERRARRGAGKGKADQARALMRGLKSVKLKDIKIEEEFCLMVGRRNKDGGIDLLGKVEAAESTVESLLTRFANKK